MTQKCVFFVLFVFALANSQLSGFISEAQQIAQLCNYNFTCMGNMPTPLDQISVASSSLTLNSWTYYDDVQLSLFECPKNYFPDQTDSTICVPKCNIKTPLSPSCAPCRSWTTCVAPSIPPGCKK